MTYLRSLLGRTNRVCSELSGYYFNGQFVRFCLFGGTTALINLGLANFFYNDKCGLALPYWFSVSAAAFLGIIVNFLLNYWFNFDCRTRSILSLFKTFSVIAFIGILLNTMLSVALLAVFEAQGIHTLASTPHIQISSKFTANFVAVGGTAFYSYAAHRFFSFNVGILARIRSFQSGARRYE